MIQFSSPFISPTLPNDHLILSSLSSHHQPLHPYFQLKILLCFTGKKTKAILRGFPQIPTSTHLLACGPYISLFFKSLSLFSIFIAFVTILLLFYVLVFWLQGMWDLSSPIRDAIHTPCIGRQSLNHWTAREVPGPYTLTWSYYCKWTALLPSKGQPFHLYPRPQILSATQAQSSSNSLLSPLHLQFPFLLHL